MKMKKWLTLGVCVTTLSMLTGIYPTSNFNNMNVYAEEVQKTMGKVENLNQQQGTFDVVVTPDNVSEVKNVRVPIWSEKSKKVVWYDAEKQEDGRWHVHFDFKNHDYLRGSYHLHAYIYTLDGQEHSYDLGKVQLDEIQSSVSAQIQNIDSVNGTYDIVIQAKSGSGIHRVIVPIWSKVDKSDLKNYEAVNENGQWIVHFNKQNHQNHVGIYHNVVEAYFNDHTGKRVSIEDVEIKGEPLSLEANVINIDSVSGNYDVVIKAEAPGGVKSVRVPIWTNAKDIKWYEAKKQADGTWTVHMDIKNHSNHLGKYTTHVYMTANDGRETAINLGQTELKGQPLELKGEIKHINSQAGSYDVVVNASAPSGVKSVRVPIWTNAKDIKWYEAKKQADGTWTVQMNIRNHNYSKGVYNTHIYMVDNNNNETAIPLSKKVEFDLPLEGFVTQIKDINKISGTYTVIVDVAKNINVTKVTVPTWNTLNKNVVWYNAEKVGISTYKAIINVQKHNNLSGIYVSHAYVTDKSDNTTSQMVGSVILDNDYESKYGKKLVFLDPGHGGYDSGAVSASGTREKDITLSVSNLVKNKLTAAGYQVIMSRYDDRYIDFVTERSRMSNVANADIFVSIHVNSGGGGVAQGVEVYWYEYDSAYPSQINQAYHNDPIRLRNSERLANSIQSNIIKQTGAINRGVRRQTYAVVRESKAPAVLIETGFIDNRNEELRLKSAQYQEELARGIADGIKQYFNK